MGNIVYKRKLNMHLWIGTVVTLDSYIALESHTEKCRVRLCAHLSRMLGLQARVLCVRTLSLKLVQLRMGKLAEPSALKSANSAV